MSPSSSKPILYIDEMQNNAVSPWGLLTVSGINDDQVEIKRISLLHGDQMKESYLTKFPMHRVPAIEHGDLLLDESGAVMRYICNSFPDKAGKYYPSDPTTRALIDRAMDWRNTCFHVPLVRATYNKLWGVPGPIFETESVVKASVVEVGDAMEYLATYLLKDRKFIAGDKPTIADMHIIPGLAYWIAFEGTELEWKMPDRVKQYQKDFHEAFPEFLADQEKVQLPTMRQFNQKFREEGFADVEPTGAAASGFGPWPLYVTAAVAVVAGYSIGRTRP